MVLCGGLLRQRAALPASKEQRFHPRSSTVCQVNLRRWRIPSARGGGPLSGQPTPSAPQSMVSIPYTPPPAPPTAPPGLPWISIFVVLGLALSSIASMVTAFILYMRPALQAAQRAAEETEKASKDMQTTALEMEKTAVMFQNDLPMTMQDLQRASEEWELVGKQVNFMVSSVTKVARPLMPNDARPAEKAAEWVGSGAGGASNSSSAGTANASQTAASLSKRVALETSAIANSLWASIDGLRHQLGWARLGPEKMEEVKRVVYIGRQQQEARSWIAAWRGRTGGLASRLAGRASIQRQHDEADLAEVRDLGRIVQKKVAGAGDGSDGSEESQMAVTVVLAALERAQRAAEEAAASSSALERAIEDAEISGALSSDEDEEFDDESDSDGESDAEQESTFFSTNA